jgi:hypothetical protein
MTGGIGDPSWIRWRLAAAIGPEIVALGLTIALAILVLTIMWLGSS